MPLRIRLVQEDGRVAREDVSDTDEPVTFVDVPAGIYEAEVMAIQPDGAVEASDAVTLIVAEPADVVVSPVWTQSTDGVRDLSVHAIVLRR